MTEFSCLECGTDGLVERRGGTARLQPLAGTVRAGLGDAGKTEVDFPTFQLEQELAKKRRLLEAVDQQERPGLSLLVAITTGIGGLAVAAESSGWQGLAIAAAFWLIAGIALWSGRKTSDRAHRKLAAIIAELEAIESRLEIAGRTAD